VAAGRRHELTDRAWAAVEPLLPPTPKRRGRPWRDHRTVVNGILWVLAAGVPWRDAPERYGPWQTLYERFARWTDDGTWDRVLRALLAEAERRGRIDWSLVCVDGSSIRALKAAAGARGKNPAHARGGAPARARRPRPGAFAGWLGEQAPRRV
jgi:transposase